MLFKISQSIVALFTAIITLFAPQIPSQGIEPSLPLVNVNPNGISQSVSTQDVTIMTFNVKINGDGYQSRENRLPKVVKTIKEHGADSFGLQEADKWWVESIAAEMSEYGYVCRYREDGIEKGESTAIFYLKDKYELVDSGSFWLSQTPDNPSFGWDAACERITTWVILKNKETGFKYAHFNTHFDHVGSQAKAESVAMISAEIAKVAPDIPVVLTGDFNTIEGSENYNSILSCGLRDTKYLAEKYDNCATYHDFNPFVINTKPIDFVFVNGYVSSVKSSRIDSDTVCLVYPSDHFPIIVEMTLFNGGAK